MKFKSIIIALGLIITMFTGIHSNDFISQNEIDNSSIIVTNEINVGKTICEPIQEETKEEVVENIKVENVIKDTQEKNVRNTEETKMESTIQTVKLETKEDTTLSTKDVQKEIQTNKSSVKSPKIEEKKQQYVKEITPSDLEYWCLHGGSHHIAGDGENEHGYYLSWEEANQAFESYTNGWNSVQYKISQCSCGLFYFWAIQ